MDDSTRYRLLLIALAQRKLSLGLAILAALVVVAGVVEALASVGRNLDLAVQGAAVLVMVYLTAATHNLSRALGHARGLRTTLACAVFLVPFACLVVPPVLLGRARRVLRAETIDAGFFTVRRAEIQWLRMESGRAVCSGCAYDLTGLGKGVVCPECGRAPV